MYRMLSKNESDLAQKAYTQSSLLPWFLHDGTVSVTLIVRKRQFKFFVWLREVFIFFQYFCFIVKICVKQSFDWKWLLLHKKCKQNLSFLKLLHCQRPIVEWCVFDDLLEIIIIIVVIRIERTIISMQCIVLLSLQSKSD